MKKSLEQLLLTNENMLIEGNINKNKVAEMARKYDSELLDLLISNDETKDFFFVETGSALIFKLDIFLQFINNKSFLPDSYTRYKQSIGLGTDDGKLISENREIVLNWPFKDCVLEGGQTKEDAKRKEVFFNETLAPDEINRLLDKKVLTNFKKFDVDGEHEVSELQDDDNLIIKGNNLIALHSLKKRFSGKIKTIYIDPPYYFEANKKEDTFKYNSNFKLSTWLVFMKNRLEVARDLLSPDGAIFVQISDDGVAEVHRLLKEVFNKSDENNFINKITVKTKSPSGFASVNAGVFETAEYILAFAKNKKKWTYNQQFVEASYDENYKFYIPNKEESYENWNILNLPEFIAKKQGFENKRTAVKELGRAAFHEMVASFALENRDKVFRYTAIGNNAGTDIVIARDASKKSPDDIISIPRENYYDVYIKSGNELAFYSKKVRAIDGVEVPSIQLSNIWMDVPYEGIAKEGGVTLKGGKKPEKLIRRILEMSSNPGDIVLDFHLGSGTTASVAHKLQRQYIGLEQLESQIENIKNRLQSVITGEQSGISRIVSWNGGGSFIYCDIKNDAQDFKNRILEANQEKVLNLFDEARNSSFLSYRVKPEISNKSDFKALSLAEQKQILSEIVDNNNLYVNYSDMEDETYNISEEEKKLNKEFYGDL